MKNIRKVSSPDEIKNEISKMKCKQVTTYFKSYTNFYVSDDKTLSWIQKKQLYILQCPDVVLIIRKRRQFLHLYFYCMDLRAFETALKNFIKDHSGAAVMDILDKDDAVSAIKEVLLRVGFHSLMKLRRMYKMNDSVISPKAFSGIVFAGKEDTDDIYHILSETFDPNGEQLPDLDELQSAALNRQIIIAREPLSGNIAAFMYFERNGGTLHLRFLASRPEYREDGFGLIVYRQCFEVNADALRCILWARDGNIKPNRLYQISGFQYDGLVDEVFYIGERDG